MFYYYNLYYAPYPQFPSYVRIFHASPDAPAVDIYANGLLIASNLKYKEFTPYLPFIPGKYSILVYPAGTKTTPVINTNLDVIPQRSYTFAISGLVKDLKPIIVSDLPSPMKPGQAQLKFVHLSPNAPLVDMTLSDGTILSRNVKFREISPNVNISSGNYTIQLRLAGTNKVVLTAPNQLLKPNRYYTIYAVGLANNRPPLQIITALDKASY
jgi:hypothetical protein